MVVSSLPGSKLTSSPPYVIVRSCAHVNHLLEEAKSRHRSKPTASSAMNQ
jgi:hypothetical protein